VTDGIRLMLGLDRQRPHTWVCLDDTGVIKFTSTRPFSLFKPLWFHMHTVIVLL